MNVYEDQSSFLQLNRNIHFVAGFAHSHLFWRRALGNAQPIRSKTPLNNECRLRLSSSARIAPVARLHGERGAERTLTPRTEATDVQHDELDEHVAISHLAIFAKFIVIRPRVRQDL